MVCPGSLKDIALWLQRESPNPYSCAAMGEIASIAVTVVVSKLTAPYPKEHIDALFGKSVPMISRVFFADRRVLAGLEWSRLTRSTTLLARLMHLDSMERKPIRAQAIKTLLHIQPD